MPSLYNGVNPRYPGLRVLNKNPPIFIVDNFLTPFECEYLINASRDSFIRSSVIGDSNIDDVRTSSSFYLSRADVPSFMRKLSLLTGKPTDHMEAPQITRYLPSQEYHEVSVRCRI